MSVTPAICTCSLCGDGWVVTRQLPAFIGSLGFECSGCASRQSDRGGLEDPFRRWSDSAIGFLAELDNLMARYQKAETCLSRGMAAELRRWRKVRDRLRSPSVHSQDGKSGSE